MIQKKINYWLIIDHPQQLLTAIVIAKIARRDKTTKRITLLISRHEYWRNVRLNKYRRYFSKIIWFDRADFPPPTMPVMKQILASGLLFLQLILLKVKVKRLGIGKHDCIIGLSACQMLEDVVISTFPQSKIIGIFQQAAVTEEKRCTKLVRVGKCRYTIGGLFYNLFRPLLGLRKISDLLLKGIDIIVDGAYFRVYKDGYAKEYDKILVMLNITSPLPIKNSDEGSLKYTYFPYFQRKAKVKKRKKVVFFGMPFIKRMCIDKLFYIRKMNQYLDFLRKTYSKRYKLEYRPHPQDLDDFKLLDLTDFILPEEKTIAELYFFEEAPRIKAVFSVCSTASRSALNFRINSYVYPNLFPIRADSRTGYSDLFGDIPKNSYLDGLTNSPRTIRIDRNIDKKVEMFERDVNWAIST